MNFKEALSRVEKSKEFDNFKKQHPKAYLCAGFFVLDFETENSTQQLDYQLEEKIATFSVNNEVKIKIQETTKQKKLDKLIKPEIEIDKLRKIADKELEKKKIVSKLNKIIAILQMYESKCIWNLTCMLESFAMLRVHVDAISGEVLKSEKASLFDFVKKVK